MHRPRNLLIALLSWAFAAAALYPAWAVASHGQRNYFEASADLLNPTRRPHVIAQMQALGVRAIRVELYWHDVAPNAKPGALLIDCSTIDVASARDVGEAMKAHGFEFVDAPVSGGIAAMRGASTTRCSPKRSGCTGRCC